MKDEDFCWECKERMKDKNIDYSLYGIKIGNFPAKVYERCYYIPWEQKQAGYLNINKNKMKLGVFLTSKIIKPSGDSIST